MLYDIVIIGAGVIGGMCARELSRYNLKIAILEKENDVACGASKANSGIIHGGYDPEPGTLKAKLNAEGVKRLYQTADELNVPFKNNGSLVVAFGREQEDTLFELLDRGTKNGISGLEIISGDKAREIEPNLSDEVSKALLVKTGGIICPYELTIAAIGNAMDNGAQLIRNFEAEEIKFDGNFTVSAKNGEKVSGRYILNCAGAYSDRIASLIGDDSFKIIPRAGEYMLLDKAEGERVKHTIFQVPTKDGKGILVSPTVDNNLLTGPTAVKADSPDCTDTTSEGLDVVRKLALKSVPSVDFRQVITSFSGVRASVASGDFIIQASEKNPSFINVAAIDSPGLTSCVSIAKYTVRQLEKAGLELEENKNFNPYREDPHAFKHMTDEEKDLFIKQNPSYGKIVCRCEKVSEGEIVDAIKRNPAAYDIDGVKRRTRSGMGRCQGGFCSPFVMKLISEINGIPLEKVTKKGGNSYVAAQKL